MNKSQKKQYLDIIKDILKKAFITAMEIQTYKEMLNIPKTMQNPVADAEMELQSDIEILKYKGKEYKILHYHYVCPVTKLEFTTGELNEINLGQIPEYRKNVLKK